MLSLFSWFRLTNDWNTDLYPHNMSASVPSGSVFLIMPRESAIDKAASTSPSASWAPSGVQIVVNVYISPLLGKTGRKSAANSVTAAGHEHNFSCEFHRLLLVLSSSVSVQESCRPCFFAFQR